MQALMLFCPRAVLFCRGIYFKTDLLFLTVLEKYNHMFQLLKFTSPYVKKAFLSLPHK